MRNRARLIAAAAFTAALAAGTAGAAVATTTGANPGVHTKTASTGGKRAAYSELAARLGVSPARLDQALREAKISLSKSSATPTERQFDAVLARLLGIPQARVRQALPAAKPGGSKAAGSKAAGSKAAASKAARYKAAMRAGHDALTAAVARELHVSMARVNAALLPLFAAGRADSSSPAFAAAARSLGVSAQQLSAALAHAKKSLAGGK